MLEKDTVVRGALKLRGLKLSKSNKNANKRSKRNKEKDKASEAQASTSKDNKPKHRRTKAELKFEEVSNKRLSNKISKIAECSHRERVEKFNKYLESLSEHYDMPKVGPG